VGMQAGAECNTGYSRGTCTPLLINGSSKMWYLYTMEFYSAMKV
jgi:hypothetical protein